jgi:hypothetical protein
MIYNLGIKVADQNKYPLLRYSRSNHFQRIEKGEPNLVCHVHHVHIFASDIDMSIKFYEEFFGGEVILDAELPGERMVY